MSRKMEDLSRCMSRLEVSGTSPLARFGHTMTSVSRTKVILFGGATGDTGKYSITGDTYCLDLASSSWSRLDRIVGTAPSPRAAHAASAVETFQLVVYGGATGGGALASDDLYLLDLRSGDDSTSWMIVPVIGSTPGRRYGHTLIFIKPHLIVFGGNTGSETVNDAWSLNVEKSPFSWVKIETAGEAPPRARVYHSACLCQTGSATGMMVIFGGRSGDSSALNDTWGLRRHRDGRWDWVKAPYKPNGDFPLARYQHSSLFVGTAMVVIGGRTNQVGESVPLEVYDTENSEWAKFASVHRFRHASWGLDTDILIHGGFEQDAPNVPTDSVLKIDTARLFTGAEPEPRPPPRAKPATKPKVPPRQSNKTPEIRLAPQVFVNMDDQRQVGGIKHVSIDRLQEEGKRMGVKPLPPGLSKATPAESISNFFLEKLLRPQEWSSFADVRLEFSREQLLELIRETEPLFRAEPTLLRMRPPLKIFGNLHGQFLDVLRFFDSWGEPSDRPGIGDIEAFDYLFLGNYIDRGVRSLETVALLLALKVKNPDQIFMLRGNHEDPTVNFQYGLADECRTRLGEDVADPNSVYAALNELFAYLPLAAVIEDKLLAVHGGIGPHFTSLEQIEDMPKPIYVSNENQILIDLLWSDPCENELDQGFPPNTTRSNSGYNIFKFGNDRVHRFLTDNRLVMMIRSHECAIDGYDRNAEGDLMTIFSATDYCGKYKNVAALLIIKRNLEIVPKVIYPLNLTTSTWIDDARKQVTPPRWKSRN